MAAPLPLRRYSDILLSFLSSEFLCVEVDIEVEVDLFQVGRRGDIFMSKVSFWSHVAMLGLRAKGEPWIWLTPMTFSGQLTWVYRVPESCLLRMHSGSRLFSIVAQNQQAIQRGSAAGYT